MNLHECVQEKHPQGQGQLSASRIALMFGVAILSLYALVWIIIITGLGLNALNVPLFSNWEWQLFSGAMVEPPKVVFGSALPYIANKVQGAFSRTVTHSEER